VERRLSVVEELEGLVNANLQRAMRRRQSILQPAFEGKLVQKGQAEISAWPQGLLITDDSPSNYGGRR
jgi:hypothetical protein